MSAILEQIKQANDIKNIDPSQYGALAEELRAVSYTHLTLPTKLEV